MKDEIQIAPVSGWDIRHVATYGVGLLTLKYLVSPLESVASAHASPNFAMSPAQLRELAGALQRTADTVEAAAASLRGEGPTH